MRWPFYRSETNTDIITRTVELVELVKACGLILLICLAMSSTTQKRLSHNLGIPFDAVHHAQNALAINDQSLQSLA
jgi:hypothetical protein